MKALPDFKYLLPYSLWRLSKLATEQKYTGEELSKKVLHPNFLSDYSYPLWESDKFTAAQFVAENRLFKPLIWLGCLDIEQKNFYTQPKNYQVRPLLGKVFQAPNLPNPQ